METTQASFDILLEKRLRGVAEPKHKILYGKSQYRDKEREAENE
jgi:hypothetical protein